MTKWFRLKVVGVKGGVEFRDIDGIASEVVGKDMETILITPVKTSKVQVRLDKEGRLWIKSKDFWRVVW